MRDDNVNVDPGVANDEDATRDNNIKVPFSSKSKSSAASIKE